MYRAIDEKKPQVVSYVLALGLKLERLAIERALDVKSVDIFQAFIDNGWDINAPLGELEASPLARVITDKPLVCWFLLHGASHLDVLQSAAESPAEGRLQVMEFLLDAGADIDAVKWKHHEESYTSFEALGLGTALHYAAKNGYAYRVELLLRRGANADVLDSTGKTALDLARAYGRDNTATLLIIHSPT